jgi:exodeoxyribonuclease V alpha subunit
MRELALKFYFKTVEKDGVDDTIIITPCKQSRCNSSEEINKIIQETLIPDTADKILFGTKEFRVGAKVIQRANNYEKNVFNGEIGYVEKIFTNNKVKMITVKFGNKVIDFTQSELSTLELAYALTVHVTQGSGYKNVIAIIDNTHFKLLDNCLLYTALTRAKTKCLLLAEPSAYKRCIEHRASERHTWLSLSGEKSTTK